LKKDIKWVRSLQQKKFRTESGCFVVEGRKGIEEGLNTDYVLHSVYTTDQTWNPAHGSPFLITPREMEQMSSLSTSSPYLAVFNQRKSAELSPNEQAVLILDGIADPGNMGTIIRTAEWFGLKTLLCTPDCVELYNPKVIQATMGSIFRMNVIVQNESEMAEMLKVKEYSVIAADLRGSDIYSFDFKQRLAIVIGSESHGIRPAMRSMIDEFVTIPGTGKTESLNASVAATIFLSENYRVNFK
jgi:TrmH family RNA methyltransferase